MSVDLIASLKAASEGSRELDGVIFAAYGGELWRKARQLAILCHEEIIDQEARRYAPDYTTSLDAAMTLLPGPGPNRCWAVSENPDRDDTRPCATVMLWNPPKIYEAFAATPALALCIAVLKARQQI